MRVLYELGIMTELSQQERSNDAAVAANANKWVVIRRAVLAAGGEMWATGAGQSMVPTIADGDRVLLGSPPARLRRGMIVLVERPRTHAMHRIVRETVSSVQTRGDNREFADAPVDRSAVIARAIAKESHGTVIPFSPTFRFGFLPLFRYLTMEGARLTRGARRKFGAIVRGKRVGKAHDG